MASDPARADIMASEAAGWDTTSTTPVTFEFGGAMFRIPRNYIERIFASPRYCDEGTRVCGRSYTPTIVALLPDLSAVTPAEQEEEYRVPWPPRNERVVLFDMFEYSEPQSKGRIEGTSGESEDVDNGLKRSLLHHNIYGTGFDGRVVNFVTFSFGACQLTSDLGMTLSIIAMFRSDKAAEWYSIDKKIVELIATWRRI
jgi:hypothetical protein